MLERLRCADDNGLTVPYAEHALLRFGEADSGAMNILNTCNDFSLHNGNANM
jgi:hypothetical protein